MQAPLDVCLQAPQNRCSLWMEQRDKTNQKFKSGIDFQIRNRIHLFIWYVHGFYCIIIVILRQEQEMTQNTPGLQVHIDMDMRELEITRQGHEISTIGSFRPSGRRDFLP